MKINEIILNESWIDNAKSIATKTGQGLGSVMKGYGALAGGAVGALGQLGAGFKAGRAATSPQQSPARTGGSLSALDHFRAGFNAGSPGVYPQPQPPQPQTSNSDPIVNQLLKDISQTLSPADKVKLYKILTKYLKSTGSLPE